MFIEYMFCLALDAVRVECFFETYCYKYVIPSGFKLISFVFL